MESARLRADRLIFLTEPGKQRCHRRRYLISASGRKRGGRGGSRGIRRAQCGTYVLHIRCRGRQELGNHDQK